jgi:hypothetical protein
MPGKSQSYSDTRPSFTTTSRIRSARFERVALGFAAEVAQKLFSVDSQENEAATPS